MAAAILVWLVAPSAGRAANTWVYGIGTETCAQWTADRDGVVASFVSGYFAGANATNADAGRNGLVGMKTDGAGIVGEVRLACRDHPAETIAVAVALTYNKIASQER